LSHSAIGVPAFVLVATALCLIPATASVIRMDVTLEELVGNSDLVVLGRVGKTTGTVWYGNRDRTIFTKHEFSIIRVLDGTPPEDTIVLLTDGGPLPSEGYPEPVFVTSGGAIQVEKGEEILAFLKRMDANEFRFAGHSHGKFGHLSTDSGEPSIAITTKRPDLLPAVLLDSGSVPTKKARGATLTLSELAEFIQRLKASPDPAEEKRNPGR